MSAIRVLIVEDSAVVREHLRRVIAADPRFEVVGTAASGEEALQIVDVVAPDVITMDVHLPGMEGFEVTRQIMAKRPTPVVIVSGLESQDVSLTMQALRAGALAVVEKPVATTNGAYETIAARLRTQLAIMSEVKVVRRREIGAGRVPVPVIRPLAVRPSTRHFKILALAASTGGPNALLQVLSALGADFPLPIVIVQHMIPSFVEGFGQWLASVSGFPVTLVKEATPLEPGKIYLAGKEAHLVVSQDSAALDDRAAIGGHRPSATVLFSSVAKHFGPAGMGILLTGMGEDGATGLSALKSEGGLTIAEAESSAVVYGMPAAAVRLGAVCESLAVGDIGARILELTRSRNEAN